MEGEGDGRRWKALDASHLRVREAVADEDERAPRHRIAPCAVKRSKEGGGRAWKGVEGR